MVSNEKLCRVCKKLKFLHEFYVNRSAIDGKQNTCKECAKFCVVKWQKENPEKKHCNQIRYCKKYPDLVKERKNKWKKENAIKISEQNAKWKKINADRVRESSNRRNAVKMNAIPAWANSFFISEIFNIAMLREKIIGIKLHVDHIVPLRSKFVCGLHCEANLQVISSIENTRKGNLKWPDMW